MRTEIDDIGDTYFTGSHGDLDAGYTGPTLRKMLSIIRPDQIAYLPWYWKRQSFCIPLAAAIFHAAKFGSASKLTTFYRASTDLEKSITRNWVSLLSRFPEVADGQTKLLRSWIRLEKPDRFLVLKGQMDQRKWAVDWTRQQSSVYLAQPEINRLVRQFAQEQGFSTYNYVIVPRYKKNPDKPCDSNL